MDKTLRVGEAGRLSSVMQICLLCIFLNREGSDHFLRAFLAALQFLTILPVPFSFDQRDFGRAPLFFPIVGLVIGLLLAALPWLLSSHLTPLLVGALVVILEVILTSGLHLDGFMDTVDALASGKEVEAILTIFKDTHTGAKSVIALFCLLFLRTALVVELLGPLVCQVLVVMAVVGRWSLVWAMGWFPYIRDRGLGTSFRQNLHPLSLLVSTALVALLSYGLLGWAGLLGFGIVFIFTQGLACVFSRRLGGLVGDIYGAFCECGEVLFLLVLIITL